MSVKITGDKALIRKLNKLSKATGNAQKFIVKAAAEVRNSIRRRTQGGHDYKGGKFTKYAESTKTFKEATGRSTSVNLSQSGEMLNAMGVAPINRGAKIFFTDKASEDKARWNHYGTRPHKITAKKEKVLLANSKAGMIFGRSVEHPGNPKRKFFRLSKSNKKLFVKELTKSMRLAMRGV